MPERGVLCRCHHQFSCTCVAGYEGTLCSTKTNGCASNPCQNGAACVDAVNGYACNCVAGYGGTLCQTMAFPDAILRRNLLSNYSYGRPVQKPTDTVHVKIGFNLYQIKELAWTDLSLLWHETDYGGLNLITLPASSIWTPLVGIRNSALNAIDSQWEKVVPLLVYSDGTTIYAPTGSFQTSCDLNMEKFPFDTQHCTIEIGNFLDTHTTVNLTTDDEQVNFDFCTPSTEFTVDANQTSIDCTTVRLSMFPDHDNEIPVIRISITLKRKPYYYVMVILLPTIVLSLLSSVIFAIPVDEGERLRVGIIILLSYSIFMLILADKTPKTSENFPMLAVYLTSVICVTAVALFCSVITIRLHHKSPRPLPGWVRCGILNRLGWLLCVGNRSKVASKKAVCDQEFHFRQELENKAMHDPDDSDLVKEMQKMQRKIEVYVEMERLQDQWKVVARVLDKLFLILFVITNLALVLVFFGSLPYA